MEPCPHCKSSDCKVATAQAALDKAIADLTGTPRPNTLRVPAAYSSLLARRRVTERMLQTAKDVCEYATFRNDHGGRCPLCRRPLCRDRSVQPTDLECGLSGPLPLAWRWAPGPEPHAHRDKCLALAWERNVEEERCRGAEVC